MPWWARYVSISSMLDESLLTCLEENLSRYQPRKENQLHDDFLIAIHHANWIWFSLFLIQLPLLTIRAFASRTCESLSAFAFYYNHLRSLASCHQQSKQDLLSAPSSFWGWLTCWAQWKKNLLCRHSSWWSFRSCQELSSQSHLPRRKSRWSTQATSRLHLGTSESHCHPCYLFLKPSGLRLSAKCNALA